MVLDKIANAERYYQLHPAFKQAFEYLKTVDPEKTEPGTYPIDGKRVYAVILHRKGKGIEKAPFETHKKYIDIQCTLTGEDLMGWKNIEDRNAEGQGYDAEKDVEKYTERPDVWIRTLPGTFAIFFPEDMHAPEGTEKEFFKVVVKVAI